MKRLLTPLLLCLLGCAGLFRSHSAVEKDIQTRLSDRYGEPFTVEKLISVKLSGGQLVDHWNYEAHPVGNPALKFLGSVNYGSRPPRHSDQYLTVQISPWLPHHILEAMGPGHRHASTRVSVNDKEEQLIHPERGAPFPPKTVTLHSELEGFTVAEGDGVEAAAATREGYLDAMRRMNVHPRGMVTVYPAVLWPYVQAWTEPTGTFARSDEDWTPFALAYANLDRPDEPATAWPRDAELETKVHTMLSEALPEARVSVVARKAERAESHTRYKIDARVAQDGLDIETLEALRTRVEALAGPHLWELRGIDSPGVDQPQRAAFKCHGHRCVAVAEALIDPALLSHLIPDLPSDDVQRDSGP